MTTDLRAIAVSVEAADPGYRWLHFERQPESDVWVVLNRSPEPSATYHQAMAEGLVALELLIDDLALGPRSMKPTDSQSHRQKEAEGAQKAEQPSAKPSKRFFGFGPVM